MTDEEYRYYTAIRMHAFDIYIHGQAMLKLFRPESCMVSL